MKSKFKYKRGFLQHFNFYKIVQNARHSKQTVLFFIVFFSFQSVCSQEVNQQTLLPNVFPVNPKAFEFVKYSEVPVSMYTGIPSISIPIYTIKTNGLDIPISLNYHSNGFRVAEEAGWTGLGWTLDAGGSVIQIVKGYDDFGWFKNRNNEAQAMVNACTTMPNSILNNCEEVTFLVQPGAHLDPSHEPTLSFFEDYSMLNGTKDMEPDIFKFQMMNYSGEFVLDWLTETYKCISDNNTKILKTGDGFNIITPDGNRFYFSLKEETIISGINRFSQLPISIPGELLNIIGQKSSRVYQLTKIITIGGDIINFNYIQTADSIENLPMISELTESYSFFRQIPYIPPMIDSENPENIFKPNYSKTINYSKQTLSYLSSIVFSQGKIEFESTNDRIDCIGMHKLNNIVLKDNSDKIIKSYNFTYDYFVGHLSGANNDQYLDVQTYHTGKVSSELTHRLKLLSVKESDKPAWLFEYDQEPLPKKTSLLFDHWGYYSGSLASGTYLKNTRAAVLNKITYPTGGYSTFDYELNSFNNYIVPDDVHSTTSSVYINDRNNVGDHPVQVFMADEPSTLSNGELNISTKGPLSALTGALSAYIRLVKLKKTTTNVNLINIHPETFWPIYYTTPLGQLSTKISDVVEDRRIFYFDFIPATQSYETFKLVQNYSLTIEPEYIYIIEAFLDGSFGPQTNSSLQANASASFTYKRNMPQDISYGAGLRIKTITTQNPNTPSIIKSYKYYGGKLMSPIIYTTKNDFDYGFCVTTSTHGSGNELIKSQDLVVVTREATSNYSFYPISTNASGKYVGYDEVEESNSVVVDGNLVSNANGKIINSYLNTPDNVGLTPINHIGIIFPPRKSNSQNGLISKNRVYDKNNTLLEQTMNNYSTVFSNCFYGRVSAAAGKYTLTIADGCLETPLYFVGFYPILSPKTLLNSTVKSSYFENDSISTKSQYLYDNHNQIKMITQLNSKNETINTYLKYPYDFSEYFFSMQLDNYITPVIEKKIEVNSGLVSTTKEEFIPMGGNQTPRAYVKSRTKTSVGLESLQDVVVYDLYGAPDSTDRYKLLQYHERNGVPISIVWAYDGQFPVAKIEGIGYTAIPISAIKEIRRLENAGTNLVSINSNIRSLLSSYMVTTYTYDPLVGMTSRTDANGVTTYYEYDDQGRLILVRDAERKVLKRYDYHYGNN